MDESFVRFERTKNSGRTVLFGFLSKIIMLLFPFAVRTVVIYKLGMEYAGLSSLFTSILSILSISELGFNSAITFCLYEPVAKNQTETINALLNLLKKLYYLVGGLILTFGLVLLPFLNHLIAGDIPSDINIYILYCLYLFSTSISYFSFAYKNVLFNVYQRGDIEHKIGRHGLRQRKIGRVIVSGAVIRVVARICVGSPAVGKLFHSVRSVPLLGKRRNNGERHHENGDESRQSRPRNGKQTFFKKTLSLRHRSRHNESGVVKHAFIGLFRR